MDVLLTQYERVFRKNRKHEERRQGEVERKARKQGLIKREYVIVHISRAYVVCVNILLFKYIFPSDKTFFPCFLHLHYYLEILYATN